MQYIIQPAIEKACLTCEKLLRGRADKKFCDDYCRNTFYNHIKGPGNNMVRNINNVLGKNRRILESLLPEGDDTIKVNKEKLHELGFQFKYFTHTYRTRAGKLYFYCYNYGYLPLENDFYLVVKAKKNQF